MPNINHIRRMNEIITDIGDMGCVDNADDIVRIVVATSNKILIANWFDKDSMCALLDEELTDTEFQQIVDEWNENGCWDDISETIREWAKLRHKYQR